MFVNARGFCRCRRGAPLALGAAGGARAYLVGGPRHAGSPRGLRMGVRAILSALRVGGGADSLPMAWLTLNEYTWAVRGVWLVLQRNLGALSVTSRHMTRTCVSCPARTPGVKNIGPKSPPAVPARPSNQTRCRKSVQVRDIIKTAPDGPWGCSGAQSTRIYPLFKALCGSCRGSAVGENPIAPKWAI